jgi:hypothetical protein
VSYGYIVQRPARSGRSGVALVVNNGARELPNYSIHATHFQRLITLRTMPSQVHLDKTVTMLPIGSEPATIHLVDSADILSPQLEIGSMHLTHTEVII